MLTKRTKRKIEGYWYSEYEKQYPKPIPNVLTKKEAEEISNLIAKLESKCGVSRFKGFSTSRITGERLGTTEFVNKDWLFPVDFRTHYVLKHRVKPSDEFLKYIGYKK